MGNKLYVGNLSYNIAEAGIRTLFESYGSVTSASVIKDHETGRSKGFAFVEMGTEQEALAAIAGCNGKEVEGRAITVNEARPRAEGSQRSGRPNVQNNRW